MLYTISIPNVAKDENIGSVFNCFFDVISKTDTIKGSDVTWDFSNTSDLHPFFLFPLAIFKSRCEKKIKCANLNEQFHEFLHDVRFNDFLTISDENNLKENLESYKNKLYLPICRFTRLNKNIDSIQTILQDIIERQENLDIKYKTPISYLISELICNINQHSQSEYGYLYSQYLPEEKSLIICIADDGITILGSYVRTHRFLNEIMASDVKAIQFALKGYSTKDFPNAEQRGYGISSTKNMVVKGLGGSFIILSGNGFYSHDMNKSISIELPKGTNWDGTVILIRIPTTIKKDFNYMSYIY